LNTGDVWIYEQTVNERRYSLNKLRNQNLVRVDIYQGNQMEILIHEKIMIYGYTIKNGHLPPGNKIFR
jgi:hypothetical protein